MSDLKKVLMVSAAIFTVVGSIGTVITGWIWFTNNFQTKDDAIIMNLENRIHGDTLWVLGQDAKRDRGITLTATELRTYKMITASIARMTIKQEEMQGL